MIAGLRFVVLAALAGTALMAWRRARNHSGAPVGIRPPRSRKADRSNPRATLRESPEWLSNYRQREDGRVGENDLIDGAIEDTFPASDPPAFVQAVIVRPPARARVAAVDDVGGKRMQGEVETVR